MAELINVAKGKRAWQSSLSKWSQLNDAERALDDDGKRDFSFHTDLEDAPWWVVDLGDQYPIHSIVIGNRRAGHQHKAKSLAVDVSRDGKTWHCIHRGKLFWHNDLTLPLNGEMLARFVRLSLPERNHLHLTKVEVWTKRSALVAAARRDDGFGNRLRSLLNAAYLSKALNCDLKISWPSKAIGLVGEFVGDVATEGKVILGHSVEPAADIFSPVYVANHIGPDDISQTSKIATRTSLTAHDLLSGSVNDASGVINGPREGLETCLSPDLAPNSEFGLADIFEQIDFSEKMNAAIEAARAVKLAQDCAAVHIRSGDIVFGNYRFHGTRFLKKAVPIPLAKMAIEQLQAGGADVILFGEDEHSLQCLRDAYSVRLASELGNGADMGGAARALFDIVLMSRMKAIWASYSGFALIATDIGRTAKLIKIHRAFGRERQAKYIAADLEQNGSSYAGQQAAFAAWSLYWLKEDAPTSDRLDILERATKYDPTNGVYAVAKASLLCASGKDQEADNAIREALDAGWVDRALWGGTGKTHILQGKIGSEFHLRDLFPPFCEAAQRGLPNAIKVKSMIEAAGYKAPVMQPPALEEP